MSDIFSTRHILAIPTCLRLNRKILKQSFKIGKKIYILDDRWKNTSLVCSLRTGQSIAIAGNNLADFT